MNMKILAWIWIIGVVLIGVFGFFLALNGEVNDKDIWMIGRVDAQLSAWIYGVMFGTSCAWITTLMDA